MSSNREPRRIMWRMSRDTWKMYLAVCADISNAEPFSADHYQAIDALKSLPGYPLEYDMAEDEILQPFVVENVHSVVH